MTQIFRNFLQPLADEVEYSTLTTASFRISTSCRGDAGIGLKLSAPTLRTPITACSGGVQAGNEQERTPLWRDIDGLGTGHPGLDSRQGYVRTGLPGFNSRQVHVITGLPGFDSRQEHVRTGLPGFDSQQRNVITGLPGFDSRQEHVKT